METMLYCRLGMRMQIYAWLLGQVRRMQENEDESGTWRESFQKLREKSGSLGGLAGSGRRRLGDVDLL